MRFVDPQRVEAVIKPDWLAQARAVREEIEAAADSKEERSAILARRSALWRGELKQALKSVMDGKCWYCETKDLRSDNAVDHFRPKGRIAEEPDHEGYWWLAFSHGNYRYACTFCNSLRQDADLGSLGGKHDHFPLRSGGKRAWGPQDPLTVELPLLLDPCNSDDVELLWFDETGIPQARLPSHDDIEQRVDRSRDIYHWKQASLTTNRRLVYLEVNAICDQADEALNWFETNADDAAARRHSDLVVKLVRMIDRGAEYSAVAKCVLLGLRTLSPSARKALDRM